MSVKIIEDITFENERIVYNKGIPVYNGGQEDRVKELTGKVAYVKFDTGEIKRFPLAINPSFAFAKQGSRVDASNWRLLDGEKVLR